ncbi:MAG: hypothetical protein K5662_04735 [Lachnospiraceae bacterium]|nr:hypothetical protein [Lachnospiraceae bacterium]
MLYDVIIRLMAATGLIIMINAGGITTSSVVMSLCVFTVLEISQLLTNRKAYWIMTGLPFAVCIKVAYASDRPWVELGILIVLAGFTFLALFMYEKMADYKELLHRTRDDSKELEDILEARNRRILQEQDQQVRLATLAERNRISREIHDNVGHLLSRAILLLGAVTTVNKDEDLEPQLKMLAGTLDESMEKMRASVHDLHDDSIDISKNFDEIIGELKNFTVNKDLDFDESIPAAVKLSLIGILKEAVTNILKHSNGDTVSVIVQRNYGFCTISVFDNGTLSKEKREQLSSENYEGIGLDNIRNRARSLGGDAFVYMEDGFTVFARLPFPK